ncbi:Adenylate cyclase, partial [uncultured Leptolyngbya sp.]
DQTPPSQQNEGLAAATRSGGALYCANLWSRQFGGLSVVPERAKSCQRPGRPV